MAEVRKRRKENVSLFRKECEPFCIADIAAICGASYPQVRKIVAPMFWNDNWEHGIRPFDSYQPLRFDAAVAQKIASLAKTQRCLNHYTPNGGSYIQREGSLIEDEDHRVFDDPLPVEVAYRRIEQDRARQAIRNKKPIPAYIRWLVWERDNFTCRRCGFRRNLAIDHIYPEKHGGEANLDNLQTLCKKCNSSKGAKIEW